MESQSILEDVNRLGLASKEFIQACHNMKRFLENMIIDTSVYKYTEASAFCLSKNQKSVEINKILVLLVSKLFPCQRQIGD
jgi:hypothetical protein